MTGTETAEPTEFKIAVAIVNYRSADLVIEGMPSLVAEIAAFREGAVIVVDNASPGDDADRLDAFVATLPPGHGVRVIRAPHNGGFASGNNIAFTVTRELGWTPDGVMLLNPDAALQPGALRTLAEAMRDRPRAGIVGAALENDDGSLRSAAFRFPSALGEFARESAFGPAQRLWPSAARVGDAPCLVDWVTGAAMLIRRETLDEIGPMDDGYFLYFEETDFMLRARRAGWEVWHAPAARVRHHAGASTGIVGGRPKEGRMPAYWFESWLRYFTKNHGAAYARLAAALRLGGLGMGAVIRRLRGRRGGPPPGFAMDFARGCLLAPLAAGRNGASKQ